MIGSPSYLELTRPSITSRTILKFGQIGPRTAELAALEHLEKFPLTYNGEIVVNTFAPSFLIGSSFLQVIRTIIRVQMSSKFGQIRQRTMELAGKSMFHVVNTRAPSFFILAGNKDNHDISDEYEIRPDRTEDCGVNCP